MGGKMTEFNSYDPLGDDDSGYSDVAFFADGGTTYTDEQLRAMLPGEPQARAVLDRAWLDRAKEGRVVSGTTADMGDTYADGAYEGDYAGAGFLGRNEDGTYDLPVGGRMVDKYDANGNWINRVVDESAWVDWRDSVGKLAAGSVLAYGAVAGAAGAGAAGGAGAGAAGSTTLGLTSAQWSAIQAAAAKGAMTSAASNALMQLHANGWDLGELDLNALAKATAIGTAGGAIGAGVGAYNPGGALTTNTTLASGINNAISGGTTALVTGASGDEIWKSALASGVGGANITGNPAIDRALAAGVTAEIQGRDGWEAALASGIGSATDYAAGQTGIDPKLLRAVIPLAQGDPTKAARLLAQYGYDTYKPDTVAYLKSLTDIPVAPDDSNYSNEGRNYPDLIERSVALDNGTDYDTNTDSGYTAPDLPIPDVQIEGEEDMDTGLPPPDVNIGYTDTGDTSTNPDVIPDQTDTPVTVDTDLPEVVYEPPPMPDITIPDVVVDTGTNKPVVNKPTTDTPAPTGGANMQALMALMQMLGKNEDDSNSGYTAPAPTNSNKSPFGEIGRDGGVYGN